MYVMGILFAFLILMAAICIHELGHMMVAKACGVGVVEYSVGMGPLLAWRRFGDTVYSLRAIPFGGYCAMYGEESVEAADANGESRDGPGRPRPDFKSDWDESRMLRNASVWKRFLIYFAGPGMNFLLGAIACLVLVGCFGAAQSMVVTDVMDDHPAAESGIMEGDVVCGIGGRQVLTMAGYNLYATSHADVLSSPAGYDMEVMRDGERVTIHASKSPDDGLFGIEFMSVPVDLDLDGLVAYTADTVKYMFYMVSDSLYMLSHGEADVRDMSGIVGVTATIAESVDEAAQEEADAFGSVCSTLLFMTALLCMNLGVMNLLPFPALDGGRIVLLGIEAAIRRPIPERVEYLVNAAGMLVLLVLMAVVLVNDVHRLFF